MTTIGKLRAYLRAILKADTLERAQSEARLALRLIDVDTAKGREAE